ncbi:uncharacterized protein YbjT (DUF2867 family) [Pontibacter ummariensis]|uniref:Uncharacterized conserved protein YbjT, contains NAD(P)-binding and DUF2867 domains n=1 Tax=Pontibacter ummariensis TaxID=1610492 RepID=A0A239F1C6_9BACT|nr:NAD(P)H-binding protein [Pontibacter ummariensis]PRY12642.1 uncharacterized protein YbjT (DUF2867 family) [Pontibacter ummariensis]SNS50635.1 Uncharacterized conserved protein YbjT, contains NAD(P)-binding and DUF2867 domains [Pontibacter ummariensis]
MTQDNYTLVMGASGNIGGKIAQELLALKASIGVVGRHEARLKQFEAQADLWVGEFGDDAFLQHALSKASSLFLTVPDEFLIDPATTAQRLGRLLKDSPVTHIVNISNCVVQKGGVATRLVALEEELNKLKGLNLIHLRSGNFFENLNWGLHTPYRPDLQLPYISSYEVAHIAAYHLYKRDFEGQVVEVLAGERDYSMQELAAAAGIAYQQLPYTPENISFYKPFNEGDFEVAARTGRGTAASLNEKFTLAYFLQHDLRLN